jgi:quercetin 2,3-dioxygenase
MITPRPSLERGHFDFGWLSTFHSFSFGDYHDPEHMGWRSLRVINEDWIQPGQGFGTHPHRDMEILTWVLEGGLQHQDSTGGGGVIRPGELQRMSAGSGISHSEFNASAAEPVHLLQIWLLPEARNLAPRYGQTEFSEAGRRNRLQLLASRSGREGSLDIHQDAELWVADLETGNAVEQTLAPGRHGWLQVARGTIAVNGTSLKAGDGAAIAEETRLHVTASEPSQFLLFDLV